MGTRVKDLGQTPVGMHSGHPLPEGSELCDPLDALTWKLVHAFGATVSTEQWLAARELLVQFQPEGEVIDLAAALGAPVTAPESQEHFETAVKPFDVWLSLIDDFSHRRDEETAPLISGGERVTMGDLRRLCSLASAPGLEITALRAENAKLKTHLRQSQESNYRLMDQLPQRSSEEPQVTAPESQERGDPNLTGAHQDLDL